VKKKQQISGFAGTCATLKELKEKRAGLDCCSIRNKQMNSRDERILKDLVDHLRDKLGRSVADFRSLCDSAGLDDKTYSAEVMITLMQLAAAYAVIHYDISVSEFARVMGSLFQRIKRQIAEDNE
jgi:hypothetical protein